MTKFIVVTGGVMSGVGKGVTTASLGKIFKERGFKTTLIKIDPYINYDAGTLRPTEHGEVWVTDDGGEIDQDLGTYERFMNEDLSKHNNITTGQVYKELIDKERNGAFLGETVQFMPHVPNEINRRIRAAVQGHDIAIIEVGGTVGDHENVPFLYALKALEREIGSEHVAHVLVTYLPIPRHLGEMKTKPTQQAIVALNSTGISPDFIICRSEQVVDSVRKRKIELYAHIDASHIISAPDVESVYQIPLDLEREGLGEKILTQLNLTTKKEPDWSAWRTLVERITKPQQKLKIAMVGKYFDVGDFSLTDSYVSIYQALIHAGAQSDVGIEVTWLDAKQFEGSGSSCGVLDGFDGIIIPGGFGAAGVEGKINAITYARTNNVPYLGLCYGLQLAAIEFARNVCGLKNAHTTEIDRGTTHPIIDLLPSQKKIMSTHRYGGTMRLGAYSALLKPESRTHALYRDGNRIEGTAHGFPIVLERHRHRYEVNPKYVTQLEKGGLVFAGYHEREDGQRLMEFIELPEHRFFCATQGHPEFKSRLGNPSPLFFGFVQASKERTVAVTCVRNKSSVLGDKAENLR